MALGVGGEVWKADLCHQTFLTTKVIARVQRHFLQFPVKYCFVGSSQPFSLKLVK